MKLISFIGTGELHETTYQFGERSFRSTCVQEALVELFPVDEVVIFATDGASLRNGAHVAERLPDARWIRIPDGRSEAELWEIFGIITASVSDQDEVLFDITHGFRSLPLVCFLTGAYLSELRRVTIAGMVYGAYEAREGETTPIFDLSDFVGILDWMAGVRSFIQHMDGRLLNDLTSERQNVFYRPGRGVDPADRPRRLKAFGEVVDGFAASVRLSRPVEAMEKAAKILEVLPEASGEVSRFVPPLGPVLEQVQALANVAAIEESTVLTWDAVERQLEIIRLQVDRGFFQQAVTLSREWMVTVLIVRRGEGARWRDRDVRSDAERALTGAGLERRGSRGVERNDWMTWLYTIAGWEELVSIWSGASEIRNDLAHCGMNDEARSTETIRRAIARLPSDMSRFLSVVRGDG